MERIILLFTFVLFLQTDAQAGIFNRYFKVVPIEEAHQQLGQSSSRKINPESLKVLVWNIKKTDMADWATEFTEFGENKDLILVQEAFRSDIFDETLKTFAGYRWDVGISILYRRQQDRGTGTMIGSKVEPTYVLVTHTPDTEAAVHTPKATTYAKYPVQGLKSQLLVISVHGINISSYDTFVRHMLQIKGEIQKHEGPVLFAGDFNTRTKARTSYLMGLIEELGFKTIEFKDGDLRMRWKFTLNYLDHAFVRGINVKNAEVIGDSYGSDHKPLILELAIPVEVTSPKKEVLPKVQEMAFAL